MSTDAPDYLAGDDGFLGPTLNLGLVQQPAGVVYTPVDSAQEQAAVSAALAVTAPNSWPVPAASTESTLESNPKLGQTLKKAADWTTENLENLATVATEIMVPGTTGYQVSSQGQTGQTEDKKWGALEWSLLAGGVTVVGVGLYLLLSKDSK